MPANAAKLNKPVSDFTDKLIKFGEDKVNEALDSINTPQPPSTESASDRYISIV